MELHKRLHDTHEKLKNHATVLSEGKITRVVGMMVEAIGCKASMGTRCLLTNSMGRLVEGEVVGFDHDKIYLMCTEFMEGLSPGGKIASTNQTATVPVGYHLLGRIIDARGNPLDNLGKIQTNVNYPLISKPINPLTRSPIKEPLDVGVRTINGLFPVGRGQRMGLFAGSGVGKSVLLGMMTRYTAADVIVVGLIGERGREVKEFIETCLGEEGLSRSVVVAAPADQPPLMRLHGAMFATSIAEYFRDQGAQVLLLMDSLTRFAQAQREIALAVGEPPATKGYPPSVFAKLPQLVERAGNAEKGGGSITAFYTVLTEGDDNQDPIADAARAILDGHIVLSRELAEAGHYPAIHVEGSISRVLQNITNIEQQKYIQKFKYYYSKYQQNRDLINLGAYKHGSDPDIDKAINALPIFKKYLLQDIEEKSTYDESALALQKILETIN